MRRAAPTAEEFQELKDRLLRTLAEMENLRGRTQREVEDARKFAVTGFARDLTRGRRQSRAAPWRRSRPRRASRASS